MNENKLIDIIRNLTKSRYIGDDCAHLPELGIVVSQDSLVEGVHFNLDWMSPHEIGVKAVKVNISDIFAAGAEPFYGLVSISIPGTYSESFFEELYSGILDGAKASSPEFEIVGGDLTGSDRVFISICVIGKTCGRNISSRGHAKSGYKILLSGEHGSSAAGLRLLQQGKSSPEILINAHKSPEINADFARLISKNVKKPYAMMDTSDGLADALFKIALSSDVTISVDFEKIPYNPDITIFDDWKNLILFGGEDYGLIAAVPEQNVPEGAVIIGDVIQKSDVPLIIKNDNGITKYSSLEGFTFNHFS